MRNVTGRRRFFGGLRFVSALYELRRLNGDVPDLSPDGLVVGGDKTSFCLQDSLPTDSASPFPDDPFRFTGFYEGCAGIVQGISRGWMDWYDPSLPGQQLLLDAVADGHYALVISIDPDGRLLESSRDDNVAWALIELANGGSKVKVL